MVRCCIVSSPSWRNSSQYKWAKVDEIFFKQKVSFAKKKFPVKTFTLHFKKNSKEVRSKVLTVIYSYLQTSTLQTTRGVPDFLPCCRLLTAHLSVQGTTCLELLLLKKVRTYRHSDEKIWTLLQNRFGSLTILTIKWLNIGLLPSYSRKEAK